MHVFDTQTGRPTGLTAPSLCRGPSGVCVPVAALHLSLDGRKLWVLPTEGPCWVAPVDGGLPRPQQRNGGPARLGAPVALAPDGRTLLVALGEVVHGLDPWTGEARGELVESGLLAPQEPRAAVTALAVDIRGEVVWTGDEAGQLQAWALRSQRPLTRRIAGGVGAVVALQWEPGADLITVVGQTGRVGLPALPASWAEQLARAGVQPLTEAERQELFEE